MPIIATTTVRISTPRWTLLDTGENAGDEICATADQAVAFAFGATAPAESVAGHRRAGGADFIAAYGAGEKVWVRANPVGPDYAVSVTIRRAA